MRAVRWGSRTEEPPVRGIVGAVRFALEHSERLTELLAAPAAAGTSLPTRDARTCRGRPGRLRTAPRRLARRPVPPPSLPPASPRPPGAAGGRSRRSQRRGGAARLGRAARGGCARRAVGRAAARRVRSSAGRTGTACTAAAVRRGGRRRVLAGTRRAGRAGRAGGRRDALGVLQFCRLAPGPAGEPWEREFEPSDAPSTY